MKATTPVQGDELYREVDEELQRERALVLTRRFGPYIIAVAVLILAAVGGHAVWRQWQTQQATQAAQFFADAETLLARGDNNAAAEAFEVAVEAGSGYAALSRLRLAQARLAARQPELAVTALDALAADAGADPLLRDLATLQSVAVQADAGDPGPLKARLDPLRRAGAPWRWAAEDLALSLAIRTGDRIAAEASLARMTGEASVPEPLKLRAQELQKALAATALAPTGTAPSPTVSPVLDGATPNTAAGQ